MSDEAMRSGQVSSTPEGGPVDAGVPAQEPGAGQVRSTPEATPLADDETLVPPTWREHMDGPVLGRTDAPSQATREETSAQDRQSTRARSDDDLAELRKWPPYSGKPVSEVRWQEIGRYAAPVVSQAEKLAIQAIDLSGRGLSKLARYLATRRQEREAEQRGEEQRGH
ncbi:MAG: hypothetical protein ACRDJC_09035 [Thermomicrobiales bacterium]